MLYKITSALFCGQCCFGRQAENWVFGVCSLCNGLSLEHLWNMSGNECFARTSLGGCHGLSCGTVIPSTL